MLNPIKIFILEHILKTENITVNRNKYNFQLLYCARGTYFTL